MKHKKAILAGTAVFIVSAVAAFSARRVRSATPSFPFRWVVSNITDTLLELKEDHCKMGDETYHLLKLGKVDAYIPTRFNKLTQKDVGSTITLGYTDTELNGTILALWAEVEPPKQ